MQSQILRDKIKNGELKLPSGVTVEAIDVMLTLLLKARSINLKGALDPDEEQLALGVFCWFKWPYKPNSYSHDISILLSHFSGIAENERLQAKFLARVSKTFIETKAPKIVKDGDPELRIPNVYAVLRRSRSHSIKRAARRYREEGIVLS